VANTAPSFQPIKNQRTFEQISAEIKSMIFQGALKPGDRLPSENELARQFQVGRHSVREALRLLEMSGFLTIHKGSQGGPVIKDTVLNTISELFRDSMQMKRVSLQELTIARIEIEKAVLNQVMASVSPESIKALEENVRQTERKIESRQSAPQENISFHRVLARASKNQVYVIVVDSIMAVLSDFLSELDTDRKISRSNAQYHRHILEAVKAKDRDRALELMEEHILMVDALLKKVPARGQRA